MGHIQLIEGQKSAFGLQLQPQLFLGSPAYSADFILANIHNYISWVLKINLSFCLFLIYIYCVYRHTHTHTHRHVCLICFSGELWLLYQERFSILFFQVIALNALVHRVTLLILQNDEHCGWQQILPSPTLTLCPRDWPFHKCHIE